MKINSDYRYTVDWAALDKIHLESNALYLYGGDPEDRSEYCAKQLERTNPHCRFVSVIYYKDDTIAIKGSEDVRVLLSDFEQLDSLLGIQTDSILYVDATGLSCRVIAPLLKHAIDNSIELRVVYVEPEIYKIAEFQKIGINKDLCESVEGISPLPGMAHIVPHHGSPIFVVLLGFEGGRFSQLIQDQNPDYQNIVPILGVPGYQINYPYISMWGNRYPLNNTKAWQKMQYAEANSIVDIYTKLSQLGFDHRDSDMVVAPIGTKPHAVGAILYAIRHSDKVEILYDNPIRTVHRTEGVGRVSVCNVSKLIAEDGRS